MSVSSVAAKLPAALLVEYAQHIGWQVDEPEALRLKGRRLGKFAAAAYESARVEIRDRIFRDFEGVDRLAKDPSRTALRDAVGDNQDIARQLKRLGSEHAHALWLLIHHAENLFARAEHALAFSSVPRFARHWLGYHLPMLPPDWRVDGLLTARLEAALAAVVQAREVDERRVKIESFQRPASVRGSDGPLLWQFSISISQRETLREEWIGADLDERPVIENRRIEIVVNPDKLVVEAVRGEIDTDLFDEVVREFAVTGLGQSRDLLPIQKRVFQLDHLQTRPTFLRHPEHGIDSVDVTQLVVGMGFGLTTTFKAAAGSSGLDAYDGASRTRRLSPETALLGKRILSVTIRVTFAPRPGETRGRIVTFTITHKNKCTLREAKELDRLILENYLVDWGFLPGDGRAQPLRAA